MPSMTKGWLRWTLSGRQGCPHLISDDDITVIVTGDRGLAAPADGSLWSRPRRVFARRPTGRSFRKDLTSGREHESRQLKYRAVMDAVVFPAQRS